MKFKSSILALAATLLLSSSSPEHSGNLKIGEEAPAIELTAAPPLLLSSDSDTYTIVNFWSAQDAASRLRNKKYADMASLEGSKMRLITICVDEDSALAKELMMIDNCFPSQSFFSEQVEESTFADYQTATGCRSFMIDPFGNLTSISPV